MPKLPEPPVIRILMQQPFVPERTPPIAYRLAARHFSCGPRMSSRGGVRHGVTALRSGGPSVASTPCGQSKTIYGPRRRLHAPWCLGSGICPAQRCIHSNVGMGQIPSAWMRFASIRTPCNNSPFRKAQSRMMGSRSWFILVAGKLGA
mgnify:CR=1 FL=1